jgi:hypothetical protein
MDEDDAFEIFDQDETSNQGSDGNSILLLLTIRTRRGRGKQIRSRVSEQAETQSCIALLRRKDLRNRVKERNTPGRSFKHQTIHDFHTYRACLRIHRDNGHRLGSVCKTCTTCDHPTRRVRNKNYENNLFSVKLCARRSPEVVRSHYVQF